jgi:dienelactone hydrolase
MNRRHLIVIALGILLSGCTSAPPEKPVEKQDTGTGVGEPRITPDVVYGHKFGMALTFDMYQPKKQNGAAVIFVNSGGWRSIFPNFYIQTAEGLRLATDKERDKMLPNTPGGPSIKPLLDKGFMVFAVRHGSSPKFEMPEIVADLRRAVRFIRFHAGEYGIDAERLGVWGGSAGGHLSLLLGTTAEVGNRDATEKFEKSTGRVAAVVACFPPSDLNRFVEFCRKNNPDILKECPALALKAEQYREFSPLSFVSSDDAATLIIHGDQDKAVPILEGESMYQALLKAGVKSKFVTIPGADHGFVGGDADRAMLETVSWFEEHLGAKK